MPIPFPSFPWSLPTICPNICLPISPKYQHVLRQGLTFSRVYRQFSSNDSIRWRIYGPGPAWFLFSDEHLYSGSTVNELEQP